MTTYQTRRYNASKLEQNHLLSPLSSTGSTLNTMSPIKESPSSSIENSPKASRKSKRSFTFKQQKEKEPVKRELKTQKSAGNTSNKMNSSKVFELLEEYRERSAIYRDEEFTQQACSFLAKIATDDKIPSEIRANSSFYYILVSISKIFMMNEYELALLACTFDHCNWNIEELVKRSEEDLLHEFPCSLEIEITKESRLLIMYLLVIAFSLKSSITEEDDMQLIQAYCEKICVNFMSIVRRANKSDVFPRITFTQLEVGKKFKFLSKKDNQEPFMKVIKDYNMVVEGILRLTGSHTVKPKTNCNAKTACGGVKIENKSKIYEESHTAESDIDTDMFYNDFRRSSDFEEEQNQAIFSKQSSFNAESYDQLKREATDELFIEEEDISKKMKFNEDMFLFLQQNREPTMNKGDSLIMEGSKYNDPEEFLNIVDLSRKSSTACNQNSDEIPMFSRFNSSLSGLFAK